MISAACSLPTNCAILEQADGPWHYLERHAKPMAFCSDRRSIPCTVTIRGDGRVLPDRLHQRDQAQLVPGIGAAHEHLDGVFAWIAARQRERDAARRANPKITLRTKQRIRTAAAPS